MMGTSTARVEGEVEAGGGKSVSFGVKGTCGVRVRFEDTAGGRRVAFAVDVALGLGLDLDLALGLTLAFAFEVEGTVVGVKEGMVSAMEAEPRSADADRVGVEVGVDED